VYAVGGILYRALTGQKPFDSDDPSATLTRVLTEEPERPRALEPSIPQALELVIQRAMAKEPQDRHASMADLEADLLPFDTEMSHEHVSHGSMQMMARPISTASKWKGAKKPLVCTPAVARTEKCFTRNGDAFAAADDRATHHGRVPGCWRLVDALAGIADVAAAGVTKPEAVSCQWPPPSRRSSCGSACWHAVGTTASVRCSSPKECGG
jgi:hypothetical protein